MGDIKIFDIEQIKNKFNIDTFFETGTLYGDTIDFYKNLFSNLISVEIDEELANKAKKRFENDKHIDIFHGKSVDAINEYLPKIEGNILFWLDAHFPGADAKKAAYDAEENDSIRVPLETELELIVNLRQNKGDVIIIDDLWLYEDGNFEWNNFDGYMKSIGSNARRDTVIKNDSSFMYRLLKDRYNYIKDNHHQGYLIAFPK